MNKRIKQLAEQAGGFPCSKDEWGFYNEGVEKFAELIVQECVRVVYQCSSADCYSGDEFVHAGNTIKQHFGVE